MKRIIFLNLLAIAFTGALAHAGEGTGSNSSSTSEFFHQSDEHVWEVTPQLTYHAAKSTIRNSTSTIETKGWLMNLDGEYGITKNYSAGLLLGYTSYDTTFSPQTSTVPAFSSTGLNDLKLYAQGTNMWGPGSIHYGLVFNIATSKQTIDKDGNTNAATGGTSIVPYVGYDLMWGSATVGAKVDFDLSRGDRKSTRTNAAGIATDTTTKEGQQLGFTLFGEMPVEKNIFGLSVNLLSANRTKQSVSVNGATATDSENKDASSTTTVKAYGVLPVHNFQLLPGIQYSTQTWPDSSITTEATNTWEVSLGGRWMF